ncbi:MAG: trypsin-like peptidase domain-containing protein [Myxococcota bacterium]|nr:trypsin-like peptidase domain-containing protein [Myxococcota bacterium]
MHLFSVSICALLVALPAFAGDPFVRHTATVDAVQKVGPSVVSITSSRAMKNPFRSAGNESIYQRFRQDFGRRQPSEVELGSGVIIDPEGHVLTNEHVTSRASQIRVKLADGRSFAANVVGADPNNDLAVLQIETDESLPWIAPGHSDDLLVGEPVIAIGNPFGLSNTVTTGVISALDRSFHTQSQSFHGFIQTDASINPGNSGGPLLNAEGTLIGINSAIYGGAQGIGFAIPIDTAKRVVSELIEHGEVTPIWLGLEFLDLKPALHEVMGVPIGVRGVLVNEVKPNSPALRAGLARGDVILSLDGRLAGGAKEVLRYLEKVLVGQDLAIDIWRDGEQKTITMRAEEIPSQQVRLLAHNMLGLALAERAQDEGFRIAGVRRGSHAAKIGIGPGDRLMAVNGRWLAEDDDLRRAIVELRGRARAVLVVQRGNDRYHVTILLV